MMAVRARVSQRLDEAVTVVCVAFVLAMLCISFAGFFYMVFTGDALSWTYSLARLFIPWVGFLSITIAFARGQHIAMTSLVGLLPAPLARIFRIANVAIATIFAGLLVYYGALLFLSSNESYLVSDQIQIHSRFVVACIPLAGLVLLIHIACGADLLTDVDPMTEARQLVEGEEEGVARP